MAKEYFEEWLPGGQQFLETAQFAMKRNWNKKAAFLLDQAAESLYHCVLLVRTFYTPHVHNLGFLRTQAERLDRRLRIWPMETRKERAIFGKLKDAYVKARYSKHYRISDEELIWLNEQVEVLGRVVHLVCAEKIAELEAAVTAQV